MRGKREREKELGKVTKKGKVRREGRKETLSKKWREKVAERKVGIDKG